jgi:hypothetical protein
LGSKIALFFIIATELDQKFWPPNSHSISTKLGLKGLGFRVAKKLIKTTLKIEQKGGFSNTHQNH